MSNVKNREKMPYLITWYHSLISLLILNGTFHFESDVWKDQKLILCSPHCTHKSLHVSVASVIFCYIHTQSITVIKDSIYLSCIWPRLNLHPSFGGNGRCKEDGNWTPLAGAKHGRGICWDKGKIELNHGSQWRRKLLSSILSQNANQSSLNAKHTMPWRHSSTFTSKFSIS